MKKIKCIVTVVLMLAVVATASAKGAGGSRSATRVTTEFGLLGGASYSWMTTSNRPEGMTADFSVSPAFGASLMFRLNIGKVFAVQPEITYNYSTIKITDSNVDFKSKVKCNTVQIPVLLSLNAAMVRFSTGPVFTLMDDPYYIVQNQKSYFGSIYPTVTYTAGVAVRLLRHMVIDLRYYGQFCERKSTNAYIHNLDMPQAYEFKTSHSSLQLRVGYAF